MANTRGPNRDLRTLLTEAAWTASALARAVNAAGAEVGIELSYDRTSVAHWLSGTRPRHPVPQLVGEVLSRRLGRSVTATTAGFPEQRNAAGSSPAGPPAKDGAIAHLAELAGLDAHPLQRAPLHRTPYKSALRHIPEWRDPAAGGTGPPSGARVGRPEVDTLKLAVRGFTTGLDRHGGGHARTALCVYLADDVAPWLRSPASDSVHRELLTESAHLVFLLARKYADSALHGIAQRYFVAALGLANEADDRTTWAIVHRGMSCQALVLDHRRAALAYGERASLALPRTAPAPARAFVTAQLAVAQAAVGNRRAALRAMGEAEQAADADESDTGPFASYPVAALKYQQAQTLHRLGDLPGAVAALDSCVLHRPPDDRRGCALTHGARTSLLMSQGHVEEASASWREFLLARSGLRSAQVSHIDRELRGLFLAYRAQPAVRALLDEVRTGLGNS
ncbi:hypothetical protein C5F59_035930 [Streptomyces sp. QL37]|uniref:hypothetical protein n=1 Tax=Streptomyces sp. QL37 TaxID=2093747 RepID=UPI000CF1E47E|nr:hypothetical protein [Streptomyces sp. QL37]PPQ61546.1 hypothetical protein C5F59_36415 [Streptomyces sp. QL37]